MKETELRQSRVLAVEWWDLWVAVSETQGSMRSVLSDHSASRLNSENSGCEQKTRCFLSVSIPFDFQKFVFWTSQNFVETFAGSLLSLPRCCFVLAHRLEASRIRHFGHIIAMNRGKKPGQDPIDKIDQGVSDLWTPKCISLTYVCLLQLKILEKIVKHSCDDQWQYDSDMFGFEPLCHIAVSGAPEWVAGVVKAPEAETLILSS